MIGAEKIEGISPLFAQVQRRPENIEKAPAGSALSVPLDTCHSAINMSDLSCLDMWSHSVAVG